MEKALTASLEKTRHTSDTSRGENKELVLPFESLCDRSLAVALERSLLVAHGLTHGGDGHWVVACRHVDADSGNPSCGGHVHFLVLQSS